MTPTTAKPNNNAEAQPPTAPSVASDAAKKRQELCDTDDIERLLVLCGLQQYLPLFELNEIDHEVLLMMKETNFEELGIESEADRQTLMEVIALKNEKQ